MDDLIITENFLPEPLQNMFDSFLHSESNSWVYSDNTVGNQDPQFSEYLREKSGVFDKIKDDGQFSTPVYNQFAPPELNRDDLIEKFTSLIWFMFDRIPEAKICEYTRIKSNLILQKDESWAGFISEPHIDFERKDHKSLLYYVNDSDGDTIIYNETYQDILAGVPLTVREKVSPRKGTAILFDSDIVHTHEWPIISKRRTIINICFSTTPQMNPQMNPQDDLQEIEI